MSCLRCKLTIAVVTLFVARVCFAQGDPCGLGFDFFQAHDWTQAAATFQQCESASPGTTNALLYRGKALVNLNEYPAAATSLASYISAHPNSDDALYLFGYVRFRQDKPKESLELFARAAKLKPPQASDLKIAALDYVLLNDYEDAARYLTESLQMDPNDLEARYHLGRVRYQQNQFDPAIAAFQEVLRHEPTSMKAEENLGLCLEAKNQNEAAIAAYRKAIQFQSESGERSEQPYLDLGKLLTTLNRTAEALAVLTQAVAIQPNSAAANYQLARAEFTEGQVEEARSHVERSVQLDPQNSSTHYLLGRIYKKMGKDAEAAEQFKITEQLIRQHGAESGGMASRR